MSVVGAFAEGVTEIQAPRVILPDSSIREKDDPLQAPRAEVGRGVSARPDNVSEL